MIREVRILHPGSALQDLEDILIQADLTTPTFLQFAEIHGDNGTFMGSIQPDMPTFMHLLLILTTLVCQVHEEDGVHWATLAKLFNQPKDSPEVARFVEIHGLRESTKGPSGSFTPDDHSYSILYRANRVDTIVFRVSPVLKEHREKHWRRYS